MAPRVLVVDPDPAAASWLTQQLLGQGFAAALAFDGATGATLAATQPPDLVVVDLFLPGPGGVGFVRHLREQRGATPLGAIYMVSPEQVGRALRDSFMGLDDFMLRPVHLPSLVERLHCLLLRMENLPAVISALGRYTARFRGATTPRRANLTVMFTDVRGFTSFAEGRDPETVAAAVNTILEHAAQSVLRFGGVIDKFLGDGMMAVFGTDDGSADHELAAMYAAQDILDTGGEAELTLLFTGMPVGLGVGISTGDVVVGPVGPEFRREATVLGDTVNLAARLCGEARAGEVLVSARTYQKIQDRVEVLSLRDALLKGKRFPQRVYSVRLR